MSSLPGISHQRGIKALEKFGFWIIRQGVNIIEAEVCPDHIHMLVEIPPKISVSSFMGFLKGKSSQSDTAPPPQKLGHLLLDTHGLCPSGF